MSESLKGLPEASRGVISDSVKEQIND